ncbi:hypothetical protein [Acinetobacter sp. ANC 3813]|uniref:hypothetical protein n=1 Tax=Acinetobacter sp. ANC 3813 TaxID=1977873 RepID=UPI000A3382FF|nr:hypothetical protein [Acinetobacter sp. ANC 3813]OTG87882.1 hypothetical protein B9T34_16230 [Acinetobacter sp. ANC 3813]
MSFSVYLCAVIAIAFFIQWGLILHWTNGALIAEFAKKRSVLSFAGFIQAHKYAFRFMLMTCIFEVALFGFCLLYFIEAFYPDYAGYICWLGTLIMYAKARIYFGIAAFTILKVQHP